MSVEEDLETQIQVASWDMLEVHYKRDALFIIEESLNYIEASAATVRDEKEKIQNWIRTNQIRRPSEAEVEEWAKDRTKDRAQFLIIQPFVFIKLM